MAANPAGASSCGWNGGCYRHLAMRLLLSTIAVAGVLLAGPAVAAENLNTNLEGICKPLRELNTELGASAAPGSPSQPRCRKSFRFQPPSAAPSGRCSSSLLPRIAAVFTDPSGVSITGSHHATSRSQTRHRSSLIGCHYGLPWSCWSCGSERRPPSRPSRCRLACLRPQGHERQCRQQLGGEQGQHPISTAGEQCQSDRRVVEP